MQPGRATFVGFDSAWTDNPAAPGAICAVTIAEGAAPRFHPPRLAGFADALAFIDAAGADADYLLVAIDQPTIVRNATGMRPAERVAASVISWIGGGVQPANRGRTGMFCDAAPVWRFLAALGARDDPIAARGASDGRHVMEVFPALALASIEPLFFRRHGAAKYNPANRRKYDPGHWRQVCAAVAACFDRRALAAPAAWCRAAAALAAPRKADQDMLDAMICVAIALHWRFEPPEASAMIGDLDHGHIVTPAAPAVRARLEQAAQLRAVPIR